MASDDETLLPESGGVATPSEADTLVADSGASLGPNRQIGRYTILRRLGSGGMGSVFEAKDPELDRTVAIKLLLAGGTGSEGESRMRREARTLAKLSHPNLVPVHDVGEAEGQLYMVMERIQGQTLDAWATAEKPTHRAIATKLAQVARGLHAAHRAGIVHRDVKPSNVMVDSEGRARVLDFGVARPMAKAAAADDASVRTAQGQLVGTPAYMTPEQIDGRDISAATDAFALGIVLYELLAGERPFRAPSSVSLLHAILSEPAPPLPESIPAPLKELVSGLLEKDPARRPADLSSVADQLEMFGTGTSLGASAVPRTEESARSKAPWGPLAAVAGVVALATWAFSGSPKHEFVEAPEEPARTKAPASHPEPRGATDWKTTPLPGQLAPTTQTVGVSRGGTWRVHIDHSGTHFGPLRGGDETTVFIEGEEIGQVVGPTAGDKAVLLRTDRGDLWEWNPENGKAKKTALSSTDARWHVSPDGTMAHSLPGSTSSEERQQLWSLEDGRVEELSGRPMHVAWAPDSSQIALAYLDGGELIVSVLSVDPVGQPRTLGRLEGARGIAWTEQGFAYCTTVGPNSQLRLAPYSEGDEALGAPRLLTEFGGECWRLWAIDGGGFVVSMGSGVETRMGSLTELESGNQLMPMSRGLRPIGWAGEGIVLAGRTGENFVIEIATPAQATTRLLTDPLPKIQYYPVWLGGGSGALYTEEGGQGVLVTGEGERKMLKGVWNPKMKPPLKRVVSGAQGKAVYLATWESSKIEAFELDPGQEKVTRVAEFSANSPNLEGLSWRHGALSPDATAMAMLAGEVDSRIVLFDLAGEKTRAVELDIAGAQILQYVAWRPEGEGWIVTGIANEEPGYRIWSVDPEGHTQRVFASPSDWYFSPFVSDDGSRLAVAAKSVETQLMLIEPVRGASE